MLSSLRETHETARGTRADPSLRTALREPKHLGRKPGSAYRVRQGSRANASYRRSPHPLGAPEFPQPTIYLARVSFAISRHAYPSRAERAFGVWPLGP